MTIGINWAAIWNVAIWDTSIWAQTASATPKHIGFIVNVGKLISR